MNSSVLRVMSEVIAARIIFPGKGNEAILARAQPLIGNSDAMSVAAEISEHLLRSSKGRFGIEPPLAGAQAAQETGESERLGQVSELPVKLQLPSEVGLLQTLEEETTKQATQHPQRQEEMRATTEPALAVR